MSNINLNMILGPEFTLKTVNQSGSPITLGVGIKYTEGIQQLPEVNLPTGGLTGQILEKKSDTTGDYHWADNIAVNGGGAVTNIDGGSASSIYLMDQKIDGGSA